MTASNSKNLAQALTHFAATGFILTADYNAARSHSVTTSNDRDALDRIMYDNEQDGDTGQVFTLADYIAAHGDKLAALRKAVLLRAEYDKALFALAEQMAGAPLERINAARIVCMDSTINAIDGAVSDVGAECLEMLETEWAQMFNVTGGKA